CLTSESLGGRSANRGQCAQACRLPYEVGCDEQDSELGDVNYLLSPQDLAAHALLPDLLAAGVTSFKIEGRLKTPEYVANVTARYREALDAALAGRSHALSPQAIEELELSFSRGFSPGWLQGCDHKMLVPGVSSAKRGVRVGLVSSVGQEGVVVRLERDLAVGDGVVFEGDRASGDEQGGRIVAIKDITSLPDRRGKAAPPTKYPRGGKTVELRFHREGIAWNQLFRGQIVWKTDDPRLTKRLRATFTQPDPVRKVELDLNVWAMAGKSLRIQALADNGACAEFESSDPLPIARNHPVTVELLRDKLGRLGGTVYRLRNLRAEIEGSPLAPLSLLGSMRQQLVERLQASLERHIPRQVDIHALTDFRNKARHRATPSQVSDEQAVVLHVLCRRLPQLEAVLGTGVKHVYADFQDLREYRDAVTLARHFAAAIHLALPRIEKPGETGIFTLVEKFEPDGILVRNLGGLRYFRERGVPCVADFSLNAANDVTIDLLRRAGAERVTVSYDLNRDQMLALLEETSGRELEVVSHQHMPMFHMEHCVFCAVLSPGTNKTNCGRPCDVHRVRLRDRTGAEHPLHADIGCRNTLYNAVPQSAAEITPTLRGRGVRHFRVELLEDPPEQAVRIVGTYEKLLAGVVSGKEVWKQLRAANRVGVTRGTLEERRNPLAVL
ncbi:MAG TPA: DUF3656 domain-containing protein, partial [Pirellulaceae bacterium]